MTDSMVREPKMAAKAGVLVVAAPGLAMGEALNRPAGRDETMVDMAKTPVGGMGDGVERPVIHYGLCRVRGKHTTAGSSAMPEYGKHVSKRMAGHSSPSNPKPQRLRRRPPPVKVSQAP